ncbi:MAG: hypothetical protein COA45_03995 [Zetaproteobacteria bacterium]|nr:MAG: hypothetical protein COA45_03995 [Zetaproteobacteria bacterium]
MPDRITLKTKDICEALEIGRHQLRAWTDTLPPYCYRKTKERSAYRYDSVDLVYFAVIKHIINNFGLSLSYIGGFSDALYSCIREPQSLTSHSFIFISEQGRKCGRLNPDGVNVEGLIVDLQPAQTLVYQFLGLPSQQTQLQLGLVKVN